MWRRIHEMWRYVVRQCENGVQCKMWPIWCDLKYGIAKWNSLLREVLVRNDGVTSVECGVAWFLMWNDAL